MVFEGVVGWLALSVLCVKALLLLRHLVALTLASVMIVKELGFGCALVEGLLLGFVWLIVRSD